MSSQKQLLQELYDEIRECDHEIEAAKEAKTRKKEVKKQIKAMEIDLVKQKKIKWKLIAFEEWFNNNNEEDTFWIFCTDSGNDMGVWKGLVQLSDEDNKHFEEYQNDYFYYGYPYYMDRNMPRAEMSECEMAFGGGDCRVIALNKYKL